MIKNVYRIGLGICISGAYVLIVSSEFGHLILAKLAIDRIASLYGVALLN